MRPRQACCWCLAVFIAAKLVYPWLSAKLEQLTWESLVAAEQQQKNSMNETQIFSKIPIVVFAGHRSHHLADLLKSLDVDRRLCIVSFNAAPSKSHAGRPESLRSSYDASRHVNFLHIKRIRVQPPSTARHATRFAHAYMKRVWVETMQRVWKLLEPYNGDVIFLEDDLLVSPDFFQTLDKVSRVKRSANGTAAFAMGGWGGENMLNAEPAGILRRASTAFPTMGYGFNRSLWQRIEENLERVLRGMPNFQDWSDAVGRALTEEYARTNDSTLASFAIKYETDVIQPTLSRVWHVGRKSSIGIDGDREVSQDAPWSQWAHLLASGVKLNYTLKKGRYNPYGRLCKPGRPCNQRCC